MIDEVWPLRLGVRAASIENRQEHKHKRSSAA
jgi:hypothetical protein